MIIEITKGDSAGAVVSVDGEKGARMIAAGVAELTDKKPPEPKATSHKAKVEIPAKSKAKANDEAK